ncbi:unnamed protein product, partial [Coregonus sp. 'balchen']
VVSMGLYIGEQAYLKSSWNVLDGFLVFVSLIDIVVSMAGGAKILGVLRLFKGKFFYCFGPDVKNITNKSDCLQANYKWVHHKYNFDNLGQGWTNR